MEYALTFPLNLEMTPYDVHQMLEDEFKLLAQCDAFKKEFDSLAEHFDVNPTCTLLRF